MKRQILIDTDILIYISREIQLARDRLKMEIETSILTISVVTKMELIIGCRNKNELQKLESFLSKYILIDLDKNISQKTLELLGKYRLSHGLLIPDALIASTAIINNFPLLTKNQSDYRFIPELELMSYP
jgi:hypothetical protein